MNIETVIDNIKPSYIPNAPTIHGPVDENGITSYYVWTNPRKGWDILIAGEQVKLPNGSGILSAHNGQMTLIVNEAVLNQSVPSSGWVLNHDFNRHPSYYTVEVEGKVMDCLIKHDNNNTSAYFSNPKSGTLTVGF